MSRELQKQQTRQRIIDVATELFKEYGFENISTRQIAKQTCIANGTLFSHFADKQVLLNVIFQETIAEKLNNHMTIASKETSGRSYFLSMAKFFYEFYQRDRRFSEALLKGSMSDMKSFEPQMMMFVEQIAYKLELDKPSLDLTQRISIAKAWFGFYMFNLLTGLSQPQTDAQDWLNKLQQDCDALLSSLSET
ncbi:TetR/AcrR family transcriptional regulator [Paraglaciecola sp.]|uniref:TetR/AcrR family transcriptional regulator n=1 Tax=Paraglaciecola sp. TaxID=1920173 RepID=UPI003EF56921